MFASKDDSTTFLDDEAALALEEDAVGAVPEDDVVFKVLDDQGLPVGDSLRLLLGREGMGDDGSPTSMLDKRLSINLGLQAKSPKEWLDSDENSQGRGPIYARHIVNLIFRVPDVLDMRHLLYDGGMGSGDDGNSDSPTSMLENRLSANLALEAKLQKND